MVLTTFPSSKYIFDTSLIGSMKLLCMLCRRIGPCLSPRGKSLGFRRVAAGTWRIFSSYGGDGHSKLVLVQQRQNNSLFMMDTSGISTRLGRTIQMLLEVSCGTEGHFLVCRVILGFLTVFKKCQASSVFEALKSASLSSCQMEVRRENEGHFLVCTVILGILSIFKKSQAPSPFEALNSAGLLAVKGM